MFTSRQTRRNIRKAATTPKRRLRGRFWGEGIHAQCFIFKVKNSVVRVLSTFQERPPGCAFSQEWILETSAASVHSQMIFIHVDNLSYRQACSAKFCRSCSCPSYKTRACTRAMPSPINLQGPSGLFRSSSSHGKKPSQATPKGGLRKSIPGRPCHEKQSDQEPGCTLQLDDRLKQVTQHRGCRPGPG